MHFDPLMERKEIVGSMHPDFRHVGAHQLLDVLLEGFAGRATDHIRRAHVQLDEEAAERQDVIRITKDGDAFAVQVLGHIAHEVQKLAAFAVNRFWHLH